MELMFIVTLGSMIVFNGALIVYFLGNTYIIPQFLPQFHQLGFGESIIYVLLGIFLFVTFFWNRITQKKRKQNTQAIKNPGMLKFSEKQK